MKIAANTWNGRDAVACAEGRSAELERGRVRRGYGAPASTYEDRGVAAPRGDSRNDGR